MRRKFLNIFVFGSALMLGIFFVRLFVPVYASGLSHCTFSVSEREEPATARVEAPKSQRFEMRACDAGDFRRDENRRGGGTIRGGVLNGKIACGAPPEYPVTRHGLALNPPAQIAVDVLVDYDGTVLSADARNIAPLFAEEAERAASRTKFSPTLLGGKNYRVKGVLIYKESHWK